MVVGTTVSVNASERRTAHVAPDSIAMTSSPTKEKRSARREALADASAGVIGSLVAMLALYPVDVWKTNAQAGRVHGASPPPSREDAVRSQVVKKLCRLFRGVEAKAAHTGASTFAYFFLHSWLQSQHRSWCASPSNRDYRPSTSARLLIAALAAVSNTLLTLPLDVLAARRQTESSTAAPPLRGDLPQENDDDDDVVHVVENEEDELDDQEEVGDEKKDDDYPAAGWTRSASRSLGHSPSDRKSRRRVWVAEMNSRKPLLKQNSKSDSSPRPLDEATKATSSVLLSRLDVAWNDHAAPPTMGKSEGDVLLEEKMDISGHDDDDATAVTDNTANKESKRRVRFQDNAKLLAIHTVPARQMPPPRGRKSPPSTTDHNVSLPPPAPGGTNGWLDLYSGLWPSLLLCSNPAIHFTAYDVMKSVLLRSPRRGRPEPSDKQQQLSMMEAFVLGFLAKFVATLVTYPLIRAKVLLMVRQEFLHPMDGNRSTRTTSLGAVWTLVGHIVQAEGIGGLYRGCNLQLLHTILKSALMMMVREQITSSTRHFFLVQPSNK